MADRILHKRSLTAGSVPSTSSLELGELAINVNDAKVFLRKSGSSGESVEALVSTNTLTSGSIFISGSVAITGSLNVTDGITGSLAGTASYAETASLAPYYTLTSSFNTFSQSYVVDSASFDTRINNLTESLFTHIVTNNGASNYIIDGVAKPILSFVPGATYRFDTTAVAGSHPFRFSTSPNGPTEYTNNVKSGSNYIQIEVNYDTPAVLYYYCTIHSGMGNAINVLRIDTLTTTASFNAFTQSYNNDSASFDTRILNNSSSISALSQSFYVFSGSYNTGSFTGSFYGVLTGSLYGTASNAVSSSYALSSSYAFNSTSGSYALSASSAQNAEDILVYAKNTSGAQINKGSVVRISGAVGDNPLIALADWTNDAQSANTLGLVTTNIANDSFGYVLTEGRFIGYDTLTPGWTAGQLLYLGPSGSITGSAPTAPLHGVRLGQVLRVQQINGSIYVRIDNGYELGELHDIVDTTTTSSYGDLLVKEGPVWRNSKQLTGSYGITGSLEGDVKIYSKNTTNPISFTSSASLYTDGGLRVTKDAYISGTLYLNNLTVYGTASIQYVTSSIYIGANSIYLNTDLPAIRFAGIQVFDSGSTGNSGSFLWDSETNHWIYAQPSGSGYTSGMAIFGPKNTGSLGSEQGMTLNYVAKGQGDDHITPSQIYDDGNTVAIAGNLQVTGSFTAGALTGSLHGTASWANNAISSSYALNATTSSYAISASAAVSASYATSASVAISSSYALSSSYAISASQAVNAQTANSSSYANNATTASYAISASQASNAVSSSYALTASHALNVPDTASYALNALSASYAISASQASNSVSSSYAISSSAAVNAQTANSSSYALTASYALFAENGGGGGISAIYIADEGATQGTASYFNFIGAGVTATVSNDTASITITGGGSGTAVQGASTVHSQSLVASTWSISHAINSRTPVVEVYDSSFNVVIPTRINNTGPFATDIYFDVPQAGYAIISTGGVIAVSGSNAILSQDVAATTWSFSHELSNKYPVFTIFDSNDDVIIPQAIHAVDSSSALIYFSTPRTGKAVASVAGPIQVVPTSSLSVTASYAISASYAATASYADNFTVRGTLTAQTIVVQTVTSSVIYSSGSNIFGDDLADTQQFTGSVSITGSLVVNGSPAILSYQTSSMSVLSASYAISASQASNAVSSSYALTASYAANVPLTASYALQALSSSYAVSASQAANAVSSSYALTASYALNAGAGAGFPYSGSAEITGSLLVSESFVDFSKASYVTGAFTGSLLGNASTSTTASYALYALSASNAPGYTVNLVQSTAASTWSFVHNLNSRNPLVQVYDSTYKQIIPNEIVAMDSATVEIRFEYSQSGYAVASNGGGLYITGSTSRIVQSAAATTWSFNHQLNTKYPAFEVYDSNDNVIIPAGIKAIDTDNAELYFAVPTTGLAIAEFSGINGLQDNAVSASHAESGSNFVVSNTLRLDGSLTDYSTVLSSIVGSNNMFTQATGSYTSAFVKYTAANGANARAGEMMVVWYNAQIQFTEATTTDIGATNDVTMSAAIVSGQLQINSQTNTSGWKIKSMATFI